jgi:16S rRNA (guanine966-N2)-methyltransferase
MRILAGRFKGRGLPVPASARPAGARLRTRLFSVLGTDLEGQRVLDVCAGAGGFGLEALSRGAASVTLLERDPQAVRALALWIQKVGAGAQATVLRLDVLRAPWPPGPYDLILLDPPFDLWPSADDSPPAAWEGSPAALLFERARGVLAPGGQLVVKLPSRQPLPEGGPWRVLDRRQEGDAAFARLA